jgi:hypothetical protein
MSKGNTGAAAGGGALYGIGILGALFYYWQQADSFWEFVGDLPEGHSLACVHGVRRVQAPMGVTPQGRSSGAAQRRSSGQTRPQYPDEHRPWQPY